MNIALGVICREDTCLITQRLASAHLGGLWEFPGGKVEDGESPQDALKREAKEELGIEIHPRQKLMVLEHDYPDRSVRLHCFLCEVREGEPQALQVQQYRWVAWADLEGYRFPEANGPLLRALAALA